LAGILPSIIVGIKYLYFPKVNLKTASLFPGLVSLIVYFVDISTED